MSKIPTLKKILQENFPDLPWMNQLAAPINTFIEEVTRAFNKRITFSDNFDGEVYEILTDGTYPLNISWNRPTKPRAVWIGAIRRLDGASASLSNAVQIDWTYNNKAEIQIDNIIGLGASGTDKFYVTLIGVTG